MKHASVKRRHVFFLSGFDPKGAAYYHRIYRTQALLQGALSGTFYTVGDRQTCANGNATWTVSSGTTETVYEYVRWDDIVRAQWPRGAWAVLLSALRVYALVLRLPGLLHEVWRVARRTLVALFYPAFFWLAVGCAAGLAAGLTAGLTAKSAQVLLAEGQGAGAIGLAGTLAAGGVLAWGWRLEKRLHTSWLLRIFRFAERCARGQVADLQNRLDGLAAQVQQALLRPDLDEVLVVGFSVGSMGAVAAVARTAQACAHTPQALAKLSVLTLGHCIPLFALMPAAQAFRSELATVGRNPELFWIDCSAPSDWGSFALVDPVALCVPAAPAGSGWRNPRAMTSPRFHTLFDTATYARLKKDKRRMHMQYLMAGQWPGVYDYFALTAGPLSLRQQDLNQHLNPAQQQNHKKALA